MTGGGLPAAADSTGHLSEGISLVLSRWTALQMAVQNEWGGHDSRRKADDLALSLLSWFSQPDKDALYMDDLEAMLDECLIEGFSAEIEDGSVEEVAEQLMIIHEECLEGKYDTIEKLRQTKPGTQQLAAEDDEDECSDDEMSNADMIIDSPRQDNASTANPNVQESPDEEGWSVVTRKNRGKR